MAICTQGCWIKGEHKGGSSSITWDAAAMVGVCEGTVLRARASGSSSITWDTVAILGVQGHWTESG